jgi:threonine dehydrogenase-like Zn-dependent dehydrogenase
MHLADRDVLAVLPEGLDDATAAVAYLFHLGYNAILRSDVRAGARVTVVGLGALGMAAVGCARLAGAEVAAVSGQARLRELARAAGVHWSGNRDDAREGSPAAGADVVVLTTNGWEDFVLALRLAGQRGTVAVLGFPGRGLPAPEGNPLPSELFYMKQLRIEAVGMSPEGPDARGFSRFNERDNLAFLLRALAGGRLDPAPFITHRVPAESLADAYAALLARAPGQLTMLLTW